MTNDSAWISFTESIEAASEVATDWNDFDARIQRCIETTALPREAALAIAADYVLSVAIDRDQPLEHIEALLENLAKHEVPPLLPFVIGRELCGWAKRTGNVTGAPQKFFASLKAQLEALDGTARKEAEHLLADCHWPITA